MKGNILLKAKDSLLKKNIAAKLPVDCSLHVKI